MIRGLAALACALTLAGGLTATAVAPAVGAPGARLVSRTEVSPQVLDIAVYSPSMDRDIALRVLRPADTSVPAPTLYLLNGAGGGEDSANWPAQTDAERFFADKPVNVVIPMEGAFSYYTDWDHDDPALAKLLKNNGRNKWTTFLTEELPPVVDAAFATTGANALAGVSMAGTSALGLSLEAPGLYRSVASYSGCAMTSDPVGKRFVSVVLGLSGADARNMWGPDASERWRANDPFLQADRLPDIPYYLSAGSGLPGLHDTLTNPRLTNSTSKLVSQMLVGGAIESAAYLCTARLAQRTAELGRTNFTFDLRPTGSHSWGYWEDDLHRSWPMLSSSLGLS